jgi:xylulokinase
MDCVLALDVGTTAVKAVLIGRDGAQRACAAREYALETPAPDHVELDPLVYWAAVRSAASAAMKQAGIEAGQVGSVGVTSQGETLILVDSAGAPLRKAIVWLDNRAVAESADIAQRFGAEEVYRRTGQQEICPTWTAAKLLWVRRHEPAVFARVHKALLAADYILYRLTGRFVSERGMTPSTLYFDIAARSWWPDMLDFAGLSASQLPELVDAQRFAAPIAPAAAAELGLSAATVVTAAPQDQIAASLGAGNVAPGIVTETTGAALALCAATAGPVYDAGRGVPVYLHAVDGQYALLPWHPTAGMALRWLRDLLGADRYDRLDELATAVPAGADGLLFLPHLSGSGCPDMDAAARGVFWGLTLGHTRGHLVRAVMESVACLTARNLELLAGMGVRATELRCLGGGARSRLWCQIKADLLNLPVRRMAHEESASMGVAMLSLLARGVYKTPAEAAGAMVRAADVLEPDPPATAAYRRVYQRYGRLDRAARRMWREI